MKSKKHIDTDLTRLWRRYRRNRLAVFGLCFLCVLILCAVFANVIAPGGYDVQNYKIQFTKPCWEHPMGTDYLGRDNLVRMIYGARISLSIGVSTTVLGTAIAVFIGMLAGFYGGKADNILMRIMDIFLSIPSILLSIVLAAVFGGGVISMILALSLGAIPGVSRLVRAMVISERDKEYIEVARTSRASDFRIMFRYILPNIHGNYFQRSGQNQSHGKLADYRGSSSADAAKKGTQANGLYALGNCGTAVGAPVFYRKLSQHDSADNLRHSGGR